MEQSRVGFGEAVDPAQVHALVNGVRRRVRVLRLRADPRHVQDASQVRRGAVARDDLDVEPLPQHEHQAVVDVVPRARLVCELLVSHRQERRDLADVAGLLGQRECRLGVGARLGGFGGRVGERRFLHVDDGVLCRGRLRQDVYDGDGPLFVQHEPPGARGFRRPTGARLKQGLDLDLLERRLRADARAVIVILKRLRLDEQLAEVDDLDAGRSVVAALSALVPHLAAILGVVGVGAGEALSGGLGLDDGVDILAEAVDFLHALADVERLLSAAAFDQLHAVEVERASLAIGGVRVIDTRFAEDVV